MHFRIVTCQTILMVDEVIPTLALHRLNVPKKFEAVQEEAVVHGNQQLLEVIHAEGRDVAANEPVVLMEEKSIGDARTCVFNINQLYYVISQTKFVY